LKEHISSAPDRLHQRNAGTGTGDGLRIATEAGATTVGMNRFYGHLISIDALTNDNLWPYPYFDSIAVAAILVDGEGRRIDDEGLGGVHVANAVARLADPQSSFVVFDQDIWESAGMSGLISVNPHLLREGGTLHRADSLTELAAMIGTPDLGATVEAFNKAVDTGAIGSLSPPRTTLKGTPQPIRTAPFYAAPICAGVTYTMGGIAVDGDARVLRADDSTIEGLYAAGTTTGGLEGGSASGYVGGLSQSAITGLLAAEHAAGWIGSQ
jgi:fumarate reductase flavoprotein subunit